MDIAVIAAAAVSLLGPFLTKGGEALAQGMGKDLWESIKKAFRSDRERALLDQLKESPTDPKLQGKVELKLEELLEANPDIAEEVRALVERMRRESGNTAIVTGDHTITVQGVHGSTITITKQP